MNYSEYYVAKRKAKELWVFDFDQCKSIDDLKNYIQQYKDDNLKYRKIVDGFVDEKIYPILNHLDVLDETDIKELKEFAISLVDTSLDYGISLEIFKGLKNYSIKNADINLATICTYYIGLIYIYMNEKIFFNEIRMNYRDLVNYDFDGLNQEAQEYYLRSLINIVMSVNDNKNHDTSNTEYEELLDLIIDTQSFFNLNRKKYSYLEPCIERLELYLKFHCTCIIRHLPLFDPSERLLNYLDNVIRELYLIKDSDLMKKEEFDQYDFIYRYMMMQYYTKKISLQALIIELYKLSEKTESRLGKIKIQLVIASFIPEFNDDEFFNDIREWIKQNFNNYLSILNNEFDDYEVTELLENFVLNFRVYNDVDLLIEDISKLTIYRDIFTHVHSTMVAKISCAICEHLLNVYPKYFIGFKNLKSVDEVLQHRLDIIDFVENGALLHDVGKIICMHVLKIQSRKLTNTEFKYVRRHANIGYNLLKGIDELKDYAYIAKYHHVNYDLKGGYPEISEEIPFKQIIDIISIADSIDAGTDNIGRRYAEDKDYPMLLKELQRGKGSRYSDIILDRFDDTINKKIENILNNDRFNIYYDSLDKIK